MAVSTINQASTVMSNHSWMTCIPNGYVGPQKFPTQNTSSMQRKRSTTLFPMRMNEKSSTSAIRREFENGHNQSGSASNCRITDSSVSKYRRVNESLTTNNAPSSNHNVKKSTIDTVILKNITQKNVELPGDSSNLESSTSKQLKENQNNENRRKLSLGEIPKYVKCFTCVRIIKEDHFSEHLLFGSVKCSVCNAYFKSCQGFQTWATEYMLGNVLCDHIFSYTGNPVKYLTGKLSSNHADNVLETAKVTTLLENYIDKLKSLQERLPWKIAIQICKDFLAVKQSQCHSLNGNEPSATNKDTFGIAKRSELNSSFTDSSWNNDRINFTSPTVEEECLGDFISQDYDIGQLEEATEFVRLPESCYSTVESQSCLYTVESQSSLSTEESQISLSTMEPQSSLSTVEPQSSLSTVKPQSSLSTVEPQSSLSTVEPQSCFSRLDSQSKKVIRKKKKETKKQKMKPESLVFEETKKSGDDSLEFVPMRSDGFYYVATKAIEECPNCYEVLCPSQFTVNVTTFLITVICMGCNLTIYIISPEVHIVTKNDKEPEANNVLKDNQKPKASTVFKDKPKRSRGRPKKPTTGKVFLKK